MYRARGLERHLEREEIEGALLLCNKQRDESWRTEEERRVDEEGESFEPAKDLMDDLVRSVRIRVYVARMQLTRARGTANVATWDFCELSIAPHLAR